jgi:peptidoglycan hydrolase-like protein with peptidoglycan-binding domain
MLPLNLEEAITNLQTYLRAISFFDERITRVPIDGIYDSETQKAVADFQRTRGLPESSVVNKNTWDAIYSEYLQIKRSTERPPSPSFFPSEPEGYISKIGEKSSFVAIVQLMLRELSVIFDTIPELVIDGVFGPQTELAIKEFQKASMLEVTGEIDLQTYNRLNNAFLSVSYFS